MIASRDARSVSSSLGAIAGAPDLLFRRSHRVSPDRSIFVWCRLRPATTCQDGAGMAAEFGDHDVIGGDADVVDPGTSAARNLPRGRDQSVAQFARLDEGDSALRRHSALVVRVAGEREGESASKKMKPPCAMRWPFTMCGCTVMVSVAWPGPTSTISMPRPELASSSAHIASAQARAIWSGESRAWRSLRSPSSGPLKQASCTRIVSYTWS